MITILMLNTLEPRCGVQQFGRRIYDIIKKSEKINVIYKEINSRNEYIEIMSSLRPSHVLCNWHNYTMRWLDDNTVLKYSSTKHYFIFHTEEVMKNYTKYLFFGDYPLKDSLMPREKSALLPRPLFRYSGEYKSNEIFTVGSFGFPFRQKGLHNLINHVNWHFDKAIINLHLPHPKIAAVESGETLRECKNIKVKAGIKINITDEFLDDDGILTFLAGNDINAFFYAENGDGLSSATDYALSVKRPIAITDCTMFRHFKTDEMLLEKHSIKEVYDLTVKSSGLFYQQHSPEKLLEKIEEIFLHE